MARAPKIKEVPRDTPVAEIPEVGEFLTAQRAIEEFKKNNPEFFTHLDNLVNDYNSKLAAAAAAVRAKQVSCGPFVLTGEPSPQYDVELLVKEMGIDFFKAHGGSAETLVKYTMPKESLQAMVRAKIIPPEVAELITSMRVAYQKVEPYSTP